jgi:DHA1 family multidrug resistance protein-like MFS transporter
MENTTLKPAKMLTPLLIVFMVAMILANLGGNMYGPLESLYLKDLGASVTTIGLFYTLSQIVPLLLQILGGWVSDSLGRLRAIAIGSVFGTISQVILVLSRSWGWVLLSSGVGAGARSLVGPSFDAFIAENSSEHNRARVFGVTQTLFGIVSVIGPPIGGWIVQNFNFRTMLVVSALLYFAATVIRLIMAKRAAKPNPNSPQHTPLTFAGLKTNLGAMFGLVFSGGVVTWILLTDGVRDISFAISFNFMGLFMEQVAALNIQTIGIMNGIFGLFMMAFMIPGGWLSDKAGERVGIAIGFFLHFISIGMIALLPPASPGWTYAIGWAVAGTGVGLVSPAYQSLISKSVPARLRGTAFGLFSTSLGLISLPAPLLGGLLWKNFFAITAVVSLLAIIPVWLKFKLPAEKKETIEPPPG